MKASKLYILKAENHLPFTKFNPRDMFYSFNGYLQLPYKLIPVRRFHILQHPSLEFHY